MQTAGYRENIEMADYHFNISDLPDEILTKNA